MLETIVLVLIVGIVIGFVFRALGMAMVERQDSLERYYAQPGP